jgi:hypothetical protein
MILAHESILTWVGTPYRASPYKPEPLVPRP